VRAPLIALVVLSVTEMGPVRSAEAEVHRLIDSDGAVIFSNVPTVYGGPPPRALDARAPAELLRMIGAVAARYGVPERLVTAVIHAESGFNPRAVSHRGAGGLMQLMPATAALLGVRDVFDPAENLDAGVRHLRGLLDRLGHDLPLALAAYNAGEGAVMRHRGIPPYPETQDYVARIMRLLGEIAPPSGRR
jgi:soluble lytic murein transglycosylase-like protein